MSVPFSFFFNVIYSSVKSCLSTQVINIWCVFFFEYFEPVPIFRNLHGLHLQCINCNFLKSVKMVPGITLHNHRSLNSLMTGFFDITLNYCQLNSWLMSFQSRAWLSQLCYVYSWFGTHYYGKPCRCQCDNWLS